jgi:hypothetical protein
MDDRLLCRSDIIIDITEGRGKWVSCEEEAVFLKTASLTNLSEQKRYIGSVSDLSS